MVYLFGIFGFISGFIVGQMFLYFMLRHKTREQLLADKMLKWKYGLLNWGLAALGCAIFVKLYQEYQILSL